ncbi:antitoxin [Streptomyces sp. BI20]|uniref:antitoxin n=1 Tax=Streptomyces sp. BI20 TaxID=3403460 RepID=UPI003C765663
MGLWDKLTGQGKTKAKEISDNVEAEINERTKGKYADQVDKAQQTIEERTGIDDDPTR